MATQVRTSEAHAHEPRHCVSSDIFNVSGEVPDGFLEASDEYLSAFAAPVKGEDGEPVCFHCGERVDAFMEMMGMGVAYRWGLAHGEANCSGCGWPARGIHRPKDADGGELWTASNLFLAYHPDFVAGRAEQAAS